MPTVQCTASATGNGDVSHQWKRNGENLIDGPNDTGSSIAGGPRRSGP
ncbi:MAG: hypothetical protein HUU22_08805 [Phycisphaerae bacterium]|nr:hypothetical protein [Phycisphaerae bacterium]NUQ46120.1 hypothetical protein [Phycisphaerae bacterium]